MASSQIKKNVIVKSIYLQMKHRIFLGPTGTSLHYKPTNETANKMETNDLVQFNCVSWRGKLKPTDFSTLWEGI